MYKKKKNIEIKYIILLIIILIISLLVVFSYILNDKKELNSIEKTLKDTGILITNVLKTPFDFIGNTITKYTNYDKIYQEYEQMKNSFEDNQILIAKNEQLSYELEELKLLIDMENTLTDYDSITARVVMRNNGYWYNTVTINKGSKDGIKSDMAVVSSEGLIGKTTNVGNYTSEIKLITTSDNTNNISSSVLSSNNNYYGIINAYDQNNNTLVLEGISNTVVVDENSNVVTSGLGGVYPSGILIGSIHSISTDNYGLAKIIKITPAADFNDISYVNILVRKS